MAWTLRNTRRVTPWRPFGHFATQLPLLNSLGSAQVVQLEDEPGARFRERTACQPIGDLSNTMKNMKKTFKSEIYYSHLFGLLVALKFEHFPRLSKSCMRRRSLRRAQGLLRSHAASTNVPLRELARQTGCAAFLRCMSTTKGAHPCDIDTFQQPNKAFYPLKLLCSLGRKWGSQWKMSKDPDPK